MKSTLNLIERIPRQPQSQASLTDQVNELHAAAIRLGLYDAADYLSVTVPREIRNERHEPIPRTGSL